MKKIFGKVWLIWAAIVFVTSWPMIWIAYQVVYQLYPKEKQHKASFAITRFWGKWILFWICIRLEVIGRQVFESPCVFVSNHQSQIDIPLNFAISKQPFVILSKQEVTKIPVASTTLKRSHVLVNRKDAQSRKQSITDLDAHLKAGRNLLLYPEGSRKNSGLLGDFKPGAFVLAIENQVPVVPITIIGSNQLNNPKKPYAIFPGKIKVIFSDPIETKGLSIDEVDSLKERCWHQIYQQLNADL